jgi:hypothetical protein
VAVARMTRTTASEWFSSTMAVRLIVARNSMLIEQPTKPLQPSAFATSSFVALA